MMNKTGKKYLGQFVSFRFFTRQSKGSFNKLPGNSGGSAEKARIKKDYKINTLFIWLI